MKRLLILAMTAYSIVSLAEQAKTNKSADLLKEPLGNAAKLVSLPAGASLDIGEKKGFWVKATAGGQTGWLKLSDIELQVTKAKIDPLATGRAGSGNIVNTSGARGLSPDELKTAKPNTGAVDSAVKSSVSVTDVDVASFMTTGRIVPKPAIPKTVLGKNGKTIPPNASVSNGKQTTPGAKNANW